MSLVFITRSLCMNITKISSCSYSSCIVVHTTLSSVYHIHHCMFLLYIHCVHCSYLIAYINIQTLYICYIGAIINISWSMSVNVITCYVFCTWSHHHHYLHFSVHMSLSISFVIVSSISLSTFFTKETVKSLQGVDCQKTSRKTLSSLQVMD